MSDLDMDLLRVFVRVAETGSFTKAGQLTGASQSAVSLKIKKLEDRLGDMLLSRSPRSVRLTSFGARFLNDARSLIDLHDRVASRALGAETRKQLLLGISDHAAGAGLPGIVAALGQSLPEYRLHVSVGLSDLLYRDFRAGLFTAVMIRSEDVGVQGRVAFEDDLVWTASRDFHWEMGDPFPFVALPDGCALRRFALRGLKEANIDFEDVFTGTGVGAVQAAVSAGLGIACLDRRNIPPGSRDVGGLYALPDLPKTMMVLFCREDDIASAILKAFQHHS
ncbi:LysR family transcriptional regulator [Roseibium aggregatum]|uniref:LysR family transcriptional regulator n=1 Tax=Roseibium aggregatum TaxID=187304 RepID=A0A939J276_9HYPH|nr:LysR family transcriptional regulator [Roseibium aggregatum]MBN9668790.1 LysR family transcriptional regulator [Roseibium aggregatum]